MSERKETVGRTLLVAFVLCAVCSLVVATAAILLKPQQIAAQEQDRAVNILQIGELYEPGVPVEQQMEQISARVVDLSTGRFTDAIAPEEAMDTPRLTRDSSRSSKVDSGEDIARINRREDYGVVYIAGDLDDIQRIILPIRGYGLWSTLWGYIALEGDLNTVVGLGYYQHSETPGMGGEVDNPSWRAQWSGKQIYEDGEVALRVLKGTVSSDSPRAHYQVDGLSGATLTTRGVDNMIRYWLGEQGYGKFLKNLKAGEA